jgi:hypothetical protein
MASGILLLARYVGAGLVTAFTAVLINIEIGMARVRLNAPERHHLPARRALWSLGTVALIVAHEPTRNAMSVAKP